ncbi:MAG: FtsX-like permease family protein, partial [Planctomycetota bacterium]
LVAALFVATTAFVRGLDGTFSGAARDDTAILLSSVSERDVIRSTVSAGLPEIVSASVTGIRTIGGEPAISSEIHMATNLRLGAEARAALNGAVGDERVHQAFVRGVTERAFLVHSNVTLTEGRHAHSGEVLVGALVAKQLGVPEDTLAIGKQLRFEGGTFTIAGRFTAPGSTTEAEIWAPLSELRGLVKRDDSSVVFVRMESPAAFADLDLFAKRRVDLELLAIPSNVYYRELVDYLRPMQWLAWAMAVMIGAAALFSGANTLNAAVQDRVRELATLRALGYGATALCTSLAIEAIVLAAAGGLLGLVLAKAFLAGSAVRIAMSAFELRVDAVGILVAFGGVIAIGILGAAPAAARVLTLPVAAALKEN